MKCLVLLLMTVFSSIMPMIMPSFPRIGILMKLCFKGHGQIQCPSISCIFKKYRQFEFVCTLLENNREGAAALTVR